MGPNDLIVDVPVGAARQIDEEEGFDLIDHEHPGRGLESVEYGVLEADPALLGQHPQDGQHLSQFPPAVPLHRTLLAR